MAGADVGDLEISYVVDALKNGWYENKYYYVETLEKEFAEWHNRKHALMTTNCTHAITLILEALNIGPGDEVIVPECTWIASMVGAAKLGATVVFCDIEEDSWCLCPESIENSITSKTKAIIAVDLFGNMANWEKLQKISEEYNIPIIEDAAEALGSTYNKIRAGKFGLASTFSFHNTKTMTTGEGGMLLLDDDDLFHKCVKIRDLGRGPDTKPYLNEVMGEKFMPFNVQAALGLAQFRRINDLIHIKRHILHVYKSRLEHLKLSFNIESLNMYNSAWITAIVLDKSYNMSKHTFIEKLAKKGIPSRPFFYPLSEVPAVYNGNVPYWYKPNPVSYSISERGVNLPGAANLTNEQLEFICDGIKEIL